MAVKIRLKRFGTKKQPHYRIVVADGRTSRDGKVIKELGIYKPLTEPAVVEFDEEAAVDYLRKGAQPSHTVKHLFQKHGILEKIHNMKHKK
ncbi:MAG: 30S ribosomal protein S16 [Candidatus Muiribacteriota bacterium]